MTRNLKKCVQTGILYSMDDLATLAQVDRVMVARLCHEGLMPQWVEVDGRRYWDKESAREAVKILIHAGMFRKVRKSA